MGEALRALTSRGRAFLAGGLTAVLCGMVLGEKDLVRVGLVGALLPLVAALWLSRPGHLLRVHRHPASRHVEVGQRAAVALQVTNLGGAARSLRLEERLPYALGVRPRFVLDLDAGESADLGYEVVPELRGGYLLGPLHLQVGDPFGLVELERSFAATDLLTVTPRVTALPVIPLRGAWSGTGENRPRSFASGNAADVTVREYRRGDDLRRVHWRSSARVGDLMVRREEQPWQSRCTLLIDNRAGVHTGRGASSSLERAIEAAASICNHLVRRGYQVRLVNADGHDLGEGWHDGGNEVTATPLLEELALLGASDTPRLATDWVDDGLAGSTFIGVLGSSDETDREFFSRIQRAGGASYAVVVDEDAGHTVGTLRALGWQAAALRQDTSLVTCWQELGR